MATSHQWRSALAAAGWPRPGGTGPILPLVIGSDQAALDPPREGGRWVIEHCHPPPHRSRRNGPITPGRASAFARWDIGRAASSPLSEPIGPDETGHRYARLERRQPFMGALDPAFQASPLVLAKR